jgi:hypothetical protein
LDTTYAAPIEVTNTTSGSIAASTEGNGNFDLDLFTTIPITVADILHGSVRYRQRMLISFSGTTQPYLGVLTENPKRQILGGFALSSDGFVVNDSNKKFQYSNESIVINEGVIPLIAPSIQRPPAMATSFPVEFRANTRYDSYIRVTRPDYAFVSSPGVDVDGNPSEGQAANVLTYYNRGALQEAVLAVRRIEINPATALPGQVPIKFYPVEGQIPQAGLPIIGQIGKIFLSPAGETPATETIVGDLNVVTTVKKINIWLTQGVGAVFTLYTEKIGVYQNADARSGSLPVALDSQPIPERALSFGEIVIPNN